MIVCSPHQIAPPSQSDVGENEHKFVEPSHPPKITPYDFRADLVVSPISRHMYFVPQPASSYSNHPPNCNVLCSSIPNSKISLNKDQSIDGVGVAQPRSVGIHEEYDKELQHPSATRDHSCLSVPPLFLPNILDDPTIPGFSCASPSMDVPILYHLQDTPDVRPSSNNAEDKSIIENPLDISCTFSGNAQGNF